MYLISAYFDQRTTKMLQNYIDRIARETGNTFMTQNHVPPHMTISAIESRNVEVLMPAVDALQGQIECGSVQLVSVGQLLPYVCYATPVLNRYLLELSARVNEAVQDIPETSVSRFYQPMSWLPHVTLGKTLDKEQMRAAFCVLQESFSPFEGQVTELGLAKVNPHEDAVRFALGKKEQRGKDNGIFDQ
ncbi:MAG: 2'-5' RNA ligase family protein [Lachnospiraceae bacterium]|nr:2'-5' RNA ligase family protein [Lachnospiraceae bacterium]